METKKKLFTSTLIEYQDDLEDKLLHCASVVHNLSNGLSDTERHDVYNKRGCSDTNHEEVCLGLLMNILADQSEAAKSYKDLTFLSRDGFTIVISTLNVIVLEKYGKLTDDSRNQVLWLVREMIRSKVVGVELVCSNLLRHAAGGDISPKNLYLIEALLNIFTEHRTWLEQTSHMIPLVVYTYLRLLEDHACNSTLVALKNKEVNFIVTLIRERFSDCLVIGRDFVRLLQNVARIPEIEQVWKDLLHNPASLMSNFTGVLQILTTRTSRRFLQSRLTPDMEKKLAFLTGSVRFGNHKKYQDWFQRQYLSTAESQTLRSDLIRFIIGVIHPSNELLCSDIIPRWAVLGWLFTTCTSACAMSNAKLALFYDWLFFDPEKDNIMNIEPAILLMHNSMKPHPAITATTLDFLCKIIPNFYPPYEERIKLGIYTSLRHILDKKVLPTLHPLFDSPKLDQELRITIREKFKEFCLPSTVEYDRQDAAPRETNNRIQHAQSPESHVDVYFDNVSPPVSADYSSLNENKRKSDHTFEEGETNKSKNFHEDSVKKEETSSELSSLESSELKDTLEELQKEVDKERKCQLMEKIVQIILEDDLDPETINVLATCLTNFLSDQIKDDNLYPPKDPDAEDALIDSISIPLFIMFRNQYQLRKDDDDRSRLLMTVIVEMYTIQPRIGYLLLYFLKVYGLEVEKSENDSSTIINSVKTNVYKDFCAQRDDEFKICLMSDLKLCHRDNVLLLCYLITDVYALFESIAVGNVEIFHLVAQSIDPNQLQDIVYQIMQSRLKMLKKESIQDFIEKTLEWESFGQFCFWQIFFVHNIRLESILPIVTRLNTTDHAEALTSIMFLLKHEKPTDKILEFLLCRDCNDEEEEDTFVISILKYWIKEYEQEMTELLATFLTSRFPSKRKRSGGKQYKVPKELLLMHLNQLRKNCIDTSELVLFNSNAMQNGLQMAAAGSNDNTKKCYSDLFAMVETNAEPTTTSTTTKTTNNAKKPPPSSNNNSHKGSKRIAHNSKDRVAKRPKKDESDVESDESIELLKPKRVKKQKKILESDSE
ncbi:hypothetical protein TKK_0002702 [Trichogramma kaykai]|uniref:SOSS complex subunit A homolog n=1 Tax=Trichogramma kaykai TaxID=54128 RepID=A0ABD2XRY1_9HYME